MAARVVGAGRLRAGHTGRPGCSGGTRGPRPEADDRFRGGDHNMIISPCPRPWARHPPHAGGGRPQPSSPPSSPCSPLSRQPTAVAQAPQRGRRHGHGRQGPRRPPPHPDRAAPRLRPGHRLPARTPRPAGRGHDRLSSSPLSRRPMPPAVSAGRRPRPQPGEPWDGRPADEARPLTVRTGKGLPWAGGPVLTFHSPWSPPVEEAAGPGPSGGSGRNPSVRTP